MTFRESLACYRGGTIWRAGERPLGSNRSSSSARREGHSRLATMNSNGERKGVPFRVGNDDFLHGIRWWFSCPRCLTPRPVALESCLPAGTGATMPAMTSVPLSSNLHSTESVWGAGEATAGAPRRRHRHPNLAASRVVTGVDLHWLQDSRRRSLPSFAAGTTWLCQTPERSV